MGNAKPRMSGEGIIDLSNDAAWQARLEEARARRAEALRKAGKTDDSPKRRVMPWEEEDQPKAEAVQREEKTDGVDFHDRINRFKKIAGVEAAREKTDEELARIDALLWGPGEAPPRTAPASQEEPVDEPAPVASEHEPLNIFKDLPDATLRLPEQAPMNSTPTSMIVAASRDAAARSLIAEAGDDIERRRAARKPISLWRGLFLATCIAVTAGSAYVTATGTFVPALFWDSTPPDLQNGVGGMPEVMPGSASSGITAPVGFGEAAGNMTGWPPALATPAGYESSSDKRPLPRPWSTI